MSRYIYLPLLGALILLSEAVGAFDRLERLKLRDEARKMFYHAYQSYIDTYPADEILPISCRGRYRQVEDLSDIDDSIGNFSLTLVDSLDTLVMMGDINEFEHAIKRIIRDLNFDTDIVVSVFETNIRMLGGLLSAHILAKSIQNTENNSIRHFNSTTRRQLDWYKYEMLNLAEDLARRLLPAFDTKTGIPHPRVNLKYGMETNGLRSVKETCTACAGSLILEFGTLSRLTGDSIFEEKARHALDSIWNHRHRSTDLVGTVLNVDSGEWVRRESGVGAGSDSYYEYLMKAYILLGDSTYLERFNRHYASVMRYISRGPFLIDVHMHRPNRIAKGFMDALSAFWPGLQVLKGDLRAAIATHAMFNEVIRRHSYLPEAFTTDLQVYWANHQMRPEFLESTYFLHRATQEDYYLEIGRDVLRKLQDLKVDCGFAGLKDVRTGVHDDKMSSFVLAETLKYLYLLFSDDNETHVDLDKFIFSTEGHLLPLNLNLLPGLKADENQVDEENWHSIAHRSHLGSSSSELVDNRMGRFDSIMSKIFATMTGGDSQPAHGLRLMDKKEIFTSSNDENSESVTREEAFKDKSSTKSKLVAVSRADLARLLVRMSDKLSRDRAVIHSDGFENSCPSLEVQEMRFDGRYHPFLNKKISQLNGKTKDQSEIISDGQMMTSPIELLEKVRLFTMQDPDYAKLASTLGLSFTLHSDGMIKLRMDESKVGPLSMGNLDEDHRVGSGQQFTGQCLLQSHA